MFSKRSDYVHSLESDDVGVFELPEVLDVCLFDVSYFLHGHFLSVQSAEEDGALGSTAHPLQVRYFLEWDLPPFWTQRKRKIGEFSCVVTFQYREMTD